MPENVLNVDFRTVDGPEPYVYVEEPKLPALTAKQMDERKAEAMAYDPVPTGERLLSYKEFCAQRDLRS